MLAEDDTPTGEYAYTGEFTPTERKAVYTFKAPGCTYIACRFIGTPDMTTGKAFVYAFMGTVGSYYAAQTTNGGTGIAGASSGASVTHDGTNFVIRWNNGVVTDTQKLPQVGLKYVWCAW